MNTNPVVAIHGTATTAASEAPSSADHSVKGKPTMSYYAKSSPEVEARTAALAAADRRKKQVIDETMLRFLEASRFASVDELEPVVEAVEALHQRFEVEIAEKAAADAEEFQRRYAREQSRSPLTPLNDPNAPLPVWRSGQLARPKRSN
jgi:hypothetical protein